MFLLLVFTGLISHVKVNKKTKRTWGDGINISVHKFDDN